MADENEPPPPRKPLDVFPVDDPEETQERVKPGPTFDPRPPGVEAASPSSGYGGGQSSQPPPPPMPPPNHAPPPGGGAGLGGAGVGGGRAAPDPAPVGGFASRAAYDGNYLLTIGKGQSGKSTFQRQLAMSLLTSTDLYAAELLTGGDWTARGMVTDWMAQYNHDRTFPAPTKVDEITEFHFRVTPQRRPRDPLEFSFLEISGEQFVEFRTFGRQGPAITPALSFLLGSPEVRPIYALMLDGEDPDGRRSTRRVGEKSIHLVDDSIFSNFLAYAGQIRARFQPAPAVAILVSKPEAAIGDQLARQNASSAARQAALFKFAKKSLPQTFGVLSDPARRIESVVFGVSIGEVVPSGSERYVAHATFEDTQDIFAWLYERFSGRNIVPFHERFMRMLTGGM